MLRLSETWPIGVARLARKGISCRSFCGLVVPEQLGDDRACGCLVVGSPVIPFGFLTQPVQRDCAVSELSSAWGETAADHAALSSDVQCAHLLAASGILLRQ